MERRDLLKMIAAATGLAFVGGEAWASGHKTTAASKALFGAGDIMLLDEIAETILPRTDTPGAKDAGSGAQMAVMVQDCYDAKQQALFVAGLAALQASCKQKYQRDFLQLTAAERTALLTQLDKDASARNAAIASNDSTNVSNRKGDASIEPHYFTLLKQLSIFVFFTSKTGATEVLRYVAVPGRYDGALPYKKGDKAWAT
ncbi:gluconate 2-dehydrogenase subunit 3 family protein [Rheinheimera texasensis]|uniref:gluconate 2-dehydrogenase subunit 3 family protein n=1 Tax=Rheinheimera texasensis TaxID=306205 RepID=UPI0032B1803A